MHADRGYKFGWIKVHSLSGVNRKAWDEFVHSAGLGTNMTYRLSSLTDFKVYACPPDISVRDVLRRIDLSPYLFQIVLDEGRRLLGTVTDGDIRRGMLHGVNLDDPVSACMHEKPITGVKGDLHGNRAKLATLGSTRSFLPVVDVNGVVSEILAATGSAGIARALVMAGGPGCRLGERTRTTPKPLLQVGGRPILDHVLDTLEDAGIEHIAIAVHYLAEQIESFVEERDGRASISLIQETRRLGTAGALGLLDVEMQSESLLVVNGDVITGIDLAALHDFHNRHGFEATVAVARHEVDIPFGVIRYGDDGLLDRIDEKPQISNFIAAGVYYLSPEYLALVPKDKEMDMPELLNTGKGIGLRAGLFPIHEYWTDVGQPDDLLKADLVAKAVE